MTTVAEISNACPLLLTRSFDDEIVVDIVGVAPPLLWSPDPALLAKYGDFEKDQLAVSDNSMFGWSRWAKTSVDARLCSLKSVVPLVTLFVRDDTGTTAVELEDSVVLVP
jgi:hypothetical protein